MLLLLSCCYLGRVGKSASSLGHLETFCQWAASLCDNLLCLWAQLTHRNCSHVLHNCGPRLLMRHHQFFQNSVWRSRDDMWVKIAHLQRVCCWRKALPLSHHRNLSRHIFPCDHPVSLSFSDERAAQGDIISREVAWLHGITTTLHTPHKVSLGGNEQS